MTLLARASSDYAEAEALLSRDLARCRRSHSRHASARGDADGHIQRHPLSDRRPGPAAVTLSQQITSRLPAGTEPAVRAYWLSKLGIRLVCAGPSRRRPACHEEAVAIRRELAAASPDRYRPDLAASLANIGKVLSELGRPDRRPAGRPRRPSAIYRELAAASPARYRPDLARSLGNLGVRLFRAGPTRRRPAGHRGGRRASAGNWPPPARTATVPTSPPR